MNELGSRIAKGWVAVALGLIMGFYGLYRAIAASKLSGLWWVSAGMLVCLLVTLNVAYGALKERDQALEPLAAVRHWPIGSANASERYEFFSRNSSACLFRMTALRLSSVPYGARLSGFSGGLRADGWSLFRAGRARGSGRLAV